MKRRDILVIIVLLAACGYLVSLHFHQKEGLHQTPQAEKSSAELELRIQQLNDLLQAITQANLARHTVEQEKPQPDLIQKLQEVTAQKEALEQELIQAKASLELVRPINPALPLDKESLSVRKGGVKQKENAADKSQIENLTKPLKEKENTLAALKGQLNEEKASRQAANKNLKSISEELRMAKNAKSALERALSESEKLNDEARAASLGTEKLRKEKEQLLVKLELLNKTYADLRNEYLRGQEVLKENETESGRRADRILVLQEKLAKAEFQLADTQLKYTEMEKESALGREQNVAGQLEREELKNQLQQAKSRLNELENQASQILKLLEPAGDARVSLPKEESKRVEVELYPIKNTETIPEEASK